MPQVVPPFIRELCAALSLPVDDIESLHITWDRGDDVPDVNVRMNPIVDTVDIQVTRPKASDE